MGFFINDTSDYHKNGLETLGWELTVCNCLEPEDSPCRKVLANPATFGMLLSGLLFKFIKRDSIKNFLEVGGGYGYISRDLLSVMPGAEAALIDISPYLLERQRETLAGLNARLIPGDFFDTDLNFLKKFDLAVFNENIGDFPCVCGLTPEILKRADDPAVREAADLIKRYSLDIPEKPFTFNLGAVKAVKQICESGIAAAYFSEHSCEAKAPPEFAKYIDTGSTGYPERIMLKDHDEYTIKFSHLETAAQSHGCRVHRGSYLDFIELSGTPLLNFVLTSGSSKDEHEVIRHFVEDLCKYEYIIITC